MLQYLKVDIQNLNVFFFIVLNINFKILKRIFPLNIYRKMKIET